MFMGVIAPPCPEHNFDGKICIKQISREETTKQKSHNQHFSYSYIINNEIKNGEWKNTCFQMGYTPTLLFDTIGEVYGLKGAVVDQLVASYDVYSSTAGKTKTLLD